MSKKMLEKLMGTDTKLNLLAFFNNAPNLRETQDELARKIGRNLSEIEQAMEDFTDLGIVKKQEVYSLCVDNYRRIQEAIARRVACGGITE